MSSRATSIRPPHITIRSSRARAPSYVPPPSPATVSSAIPNVAAPEVDLCGTNRSFCPEPDSKYTTMPRAVLASILSVFPAKSERHKLYSLSSSSTSSVDSFSLPLPASPQQATFGGDVWQKDGHFRTGGRPTARETRLGPLGGVTTYAPLAVLFVLFPLSAALVLASLFSLPITASFPRTLSELSQLGLELQAYSESGFRPRAHVLGVLSLVAVWKHAWSVPGSVLLNVLSGVLMPPVWATLLMTFLTAFGSVLSSLLATPLAPIISHVVPKALALTRNALEGGDAFTTSPRDRSPGWVRLSVLRLIGVVPWSGINIACGVTGVSLFDCLLGAFIGTLPWTAVTCQIGDIMQTVATTTTADPETLGSLLHSPNVVFKLAALTFVSLVPILARDRLKGLIGRAPEQEEAEPKVAVMKDARGQRWWSKQWRARKGEEGVAVVEMAVSTEKPEIKSMPS